MTAFTGIATLAARGVTVVRVIPFDNINRAVVPKQQVGLTIEFTPVSGTHAITFGSTTLTWQKADISSPVDFEATPSWPNPNLSAIEYKWYFGDGTIGYGATVSHTYNFPNTDTEVVCVLTDNLGRKWAARKRIYLEP